MRGSHKARKGGHFHLDASKFYEYAIDQELAALKMKSKYLPYGCDTIRFCRYETGEIQILKAMFMLIVYQIDLEMSLKESDDDQRQPVQKIQDLRRVVEE